MLFTDFATYFDCPTSTTTQKTVAQTFSGNGTGIILKLKSKYNQNCAFMLDVSLFSDFTDECERLFLNEHLIITDILTIIDNRWKSFHKEMGALLYFNKITTGNAADATWNIKNKPYIQNCLVNILLDYYGKSDSITNDIPDYIRVLFEHYCNKHTTPRFEGLDKIQHTLVPKLQALIFGNTILKEEEIVNNGKPKVSSYWVKETFPFAQKYVSDQGGDPIFVGDDELTHDNGTNYSLQNHSLQKPPSIDPIKTQRSLSATMKWKLKKEL